MNECVWMACPSTAKEVEAIVRAQGAIPATVGVLKGKVHVGLSEEELDFLSRSKTALKVSRRDLPYVISKVRSFTNMIECSKKKMQTVYRQWVMSNRRQWMVFGMMWMFTVISCELSICIWLYSVYLTNLQGLSGGTTVSGTMIAAHSAGIPVFVTGGIGGVHRDGENSKKPQAFGIQKLLRWCFILLFLLLIPLLQ